MYYAKIDAQPVAVGVVEETVIDATPTRGEDVLLVTVENLSATETFTGVMYNSPNGATQWNAETSDEFVDIAPLKTRRYLVQPDRIFARLLGNFVGAPGSVRVSVFVLPGPKMWTPLGAG